LAGVYHVGLEINIFYFSLGIIFSIIYFTLFINRMFFKGPLPDMLRPTVFILLAPPAIGFMSYVKIFGQASAFAFILYGLAFYVCVFYIKLNTIYKFDFMYRGMQCYSQQQK